MQALTVSLLGAAVGLAAWLAARVWPIPSQAPDAGRQATLVAGLWGWRGAVLLPSCLALWGAYAGWQTADLGRAAQAVAFSGVLLLISIVDLGTQRIPPALLFALLGLALAQAIWLGRPAPWSALLGMALGGAVLSLLALPRRGALSAGDIRLAAALGAVLAVPDILPALGAGILAGGAGALWLLATKRAGRRDRMAYAPYLALGAWLVWTRSVGLWP